MRALLKTAKKSALPALFALLGMVTEFQSFQVRVIESFKLKAC